MSATRTRTPPGQKKPSTNGTIALPGACHAEREAERTTGGGTDEKARSLAIGGGACFRGHICSEAARSGTGQRRVGASLPHAYHSDSRYAGPLRPYECRQQTRSDLRNSVRKRHGRGAAT